ncbi:MAG: globin domain-containing protein [Bacteroidota bacterium]
MEKEEIIAVQRSWQLIMNHMNEIGEKFYDNLFEEEPVLETLFRNDKKEQAGKLMQLIGLAVTKLHLKAPDAPIDRVGKRHVAYGVKPEYFPKFGEVLIKTFADSLKDEWSPELESAWQKAYANLSAMMIESGYGKQE